ncbi:MAG: hypothetical protein V3U89_04810 [Methylophilaceae bacterium]
MNNVNISWKSFFDLLPNAISVGKFLLVIVALDLLISIGLSFFISDSFYIKRYLNFDLYENASSYDSRIEKYFDNAFYLKPNLKTGWVNTPNFIKKELYWNTNSLGARVSPEQQKIDSLPDESDDNLIFLLGSSVINGYKQEYKDTPSNHLTSYGYSVFDFGTVMYSIDQTFELYKNTLAQYKPKVIVVGIHNEPEVISNMFIPLRIHDTSVPFLKPAYYLSGNKIVERNAPVEHQRRKALLLMFSELKEHDAHYYKFQIYKRLSLLPFSDLVRKGIMAVEKEFFKADEYIKAFELQKAFMEKMTALAKKNGAEVIFIKFEALEDIKKPFYQQLYKDRNTIHTELLKETSMNILITSEIFKETGQPISDFYGKYDTVHLSANACEVLAKKIDQEIKKITAEKLHH